MTEAEPCAHFTVELVDLWLFRNIVCHRSAIGAYRTDLFRSLVKIVCEILAVRRFSRPSDALLLTRWISLVLHCQFLVFICFCIELVCFRFEVFGQLLVVLHSFRTGDESLEFLLAHMVGVCRPQ